MAEPQRVVNVEQIPNVRWWSPEMKEKAPERYEEEKKEGILVDEYLLYEVLSASNVLDPHIGQRLTLSQTQDLIDDGIKVNIK